jgi:hypothetical protein
MTIAIGRAGWDTSLTLNSPRTWSSNGPEVDLAGTLTASTLGRLIVARAQLNGLIDNPDEPVVPVVWSADTSVTGFYEVLDGGVAMPPRGLAALKLDYRLRLRKVSTYPDINSRMLGDAVRTNAHSIAKGSTVPFWAVPDDATMDYIPNATAATRAAESGTVKVWYRTDGTVLYNRTNRWQCGAVGLLRRGLPVRDHPRRVHLVRPRRAVPPRVAPRVRLADLQRAGAGVGLVR